MLCSPQQEKLICQDGWMLGVFCLRYFHTFLNGLEKEY